MLKKINLKIITLVIIIVLAIIAFFWYKNYQKAKISILTYPTNAIIKINGSEYKNGDSDIDPGKYSVVISSTGYTEKKFEIEIQPRSKFSINEALKSNNSDESDDDDEAHLIKDGIESRKFINSSLALEQKYPIIKKLPINDTDSRKRYNIYQTIENNELKNITIKINDECNKSLYDTYKRSALIRLKELDKDAESKYPIKYESNCKK